MNWKPHLLELDEGKEHHMRLEGRRILITGAGSGIGKAIAEQFYREGANLALLDLREEQFHTIIKRCPGALAVAADVSNADQVTLAVSQATEALGGLDGIVNVAGMDLIRDFESMTTTEWRRAISVNLDGPMHVCKAALPALRACRQGTIVNISSAAGLRPLENRTAYCTSKAGLIMFTKALALELAPRDIRANVICPGVIDTPMLRVSYENAEDPQAAYQEIVSRPAVGRVGTTEDVSYAALYLTCDESSYTTGSVLTVDGGRAFH